MDGWMDGWMDDKTTTTQPQTGMQRPVVVNSFGSPAPLYLAPPPPHEEPMHTKDACDQNGVDVRCGGVVCGGGVECGGGVGCGGVECGGVGCGGVGCGGVGCGGVGCGGMGGEERNECMGGMGCGDGRGCGVDDETPHVIPRVDDFVNNDKPMHENNNVINNNNNKIIDNEKNNYNNNNKNNNNNTNNNNNNNDKNKDNNGNQAGYGNLKHLHSDDVINNNNNINNSSNNNNNIIISNNSNGNIINNNLPAPYWLLDYNGVTYFYPIQPMADNWVNPLTNETVAKFNNMNLTNQNGVSSQVWGVLG